MKDWTDGIKAGDKFNARVKQGPHSRSILGGQELAGKISCGCPDVAISVHSNTINSELFNYCRQDFSFERLPD